jgi:hypothetical protein
MSTFFSTFSGNRNSEALTTQTEKASNLTMAAKLCENCGKIPFNRRLKKISTMASATEWSLGTFALVRSRSCPFCKLLASIYVQGIGTSPWHKLTPPDDAVDIRVRYTIDGFIDEYSPSGTTLCHIGDPTGRLPFPARAAFDEWIDFNELKRWISVCDENHGVESSKCTSTPFHPGILPRSGKRQLDFRLIDVRAMCLIYPRPRCKYVALSYVWGATSRAKLTLTSHNEEALLQPAALERHRPMIPATIMDAIIVVRNLGEQYLWVDSLCIRQDDANELEACVAIMDLVYDMASFTIVAAGGEDAFSGIHGVPPTPRRMNRLVQDIVPGLKMTIVADVSELLRRSPYHSRAWT